MILVYLLFALTVSSVLTALFSASVPENRKGEAFMGFFAALMVLAWAADEWLLPALAAGLKTSWIPLLTLVIFGGVLAASAILAARTTGPLQHAFVDHDSRLNGEAVIFDLVLWSALLVSGIAVLKSIGP
jgi:protein-S-isoprenylcysteine O-methyltransferase Ste14